MRNIKRLYQLPFEDKFLLIEVIVILVFSKLFIKLIRFDRLSSWVGKMHTETSKIYISDHLNLIKVKSFIQKTAKRLPWDSVCYDKAIAAKLLLNRRNIPSTLYIGLAKSDEDSLEGHAWVRSGTLFVTGGTERKNYKPIVFFS